MNNVKVKAYKKVLKKIAEDFINNKTNEIWFQEKFSGKEVIYFLFSFLQFMFPY